MGVGVFQKLTDLDTGDPAVIAKRAEDLGFASYWVPEHAVIPEGSADIYPGKEDGQPTPDYLFKMPDPFIALAPDWVCEVLSESTRRVDRMHKLPIYADQGVGHAWLIDPIDRTLEVFRLDRGRWLLVSTHEREDEARAEPFDAVPLDLAPLWDRGQPPDA